MKTPKRSTATILVAVVVAATGLAVAWGDDKDDDGDRAAFLRSSVSLAAAAMTAESQTGARAIAGAFELEDDVYMFEITVVTSVGREIEVEVDAQTGAILDIETEDEEDDE